MYVCVCVCVCVCMCECMYVLHSSNHWWSDSGECQQRETINMRNLFWSCDHTKHVLCRAALENAWLKLSFTND